MKTRRQARVLALEALFEVDSVNHPPDLVLRQRLEAEPLPAAGQVFASHLVKGVLEHLPELDKTIEAIATEWPLAQMAIVDRNILRIAMYEITVDRQTPVKVVINEAVELAKRFGSDSSRRFVNGVLGTLVSNRDLAPARRSKTS